jgi:hypothetical protein
MAKIAALSHFSTKVFQCLLATNGLVRTLRRLAAALRRVIAKLGVKM